MKYSIGSKVVFDVPWFLGKNKVLGTVAQFGVMGLYSVTLDIPLHFTVDGLDEEVTDILMREESLELCN